MSCLEALCLRFIGEAVLSAPILIILKKPHLCPTIVSYGSRLHVAMGQQYGIQETSEHVGTIQMNLIKFWWLNEPRTTQFW